MSDIRTADDAESRHVRNSGLANDALGWLSLNRYGAICLNSTKILFGDIDCIPSSKNPFKPVMEWAEAIAAAADCSRAENLQLRIYRTFAGLRLIEASDTHIPNSDRSLDLLGALGCDSAYVALTRKLNNFRVRLTPKPWRVAKDDIADFSKEGAIDRYLKAPKYRIAAYMGTLGREGVPMPPEVAQIVALHDQFCSAHNEELNLA
jgi:hypothetical protein